jgi:hypothetical protein
MPKSPKEMIDAVRRNLPQKTGNTFEQWVSLAKKQGPQEQKALTGWLKSKHSLGSVTAHFIALEVVGKSVVDAYADEARCSTGCTPASGRRFDRCTIASPRPRKCSATTSC